MQNNDVVSTAVTTHSAQKSDGSSISDTKSSIPTGMYVCIYVLYVQNNNCADILGFVHVFNVRTCIYVTTCYAYVTTYIHSYLLYVTCIYT